jgi:hypothetical protein
MQEDSVFNFYGFAEENKLSFSKKESPYLEIYSSVFMITESFFVLVYELSVNKRVF